MRAERERNPSGKAQPAEDGKRRLRLTIRRGWRGIVSLASVGLGVAACGGTATGPTSGPGTGPTAPVVGKTGVLPPGVRPVKPAGHLAGVKCLAFSPDGRRLVSGSNDATLLVWDVQSGEVVQRLEGHRGFVSACAFLPGERVVTGGSRGEVFVWDVATGKPLRKLESLPTGHDVLALGVQPDGREVIAGTDAGLVVAWNPDTGEVSFAPNGELAGSPNASTVWAVGFTSEGQRFAGGDAGKTIV